MKKMDTTAETAIVTALKDDFDRGFRMLMDRYKEPVYWHIRRLVVAHDDAEDAVQETFVRIFRSFGQFGGGSLTAWVYRIATNEALRLAGRRKTAEKPLDDSDIRIGTVAADKYIDYDDMEAVVLQNAIHSLPPKQQVVFSLRYYEEMSYEDIAVAADTSAASAKASYHVAKEKIIRQMNSMFQDYG